MANKFKVMASNAKEPDGKCIPKSMRKDVKSGCTKKSVKASDTAKKFRVDIYKKDNPDALVKREVKTFNSEDEAKKYGESIANGDIVNVIEVKAGCTKKSVKSSKGLTVPKSKRKSVKASKTAAKSVKKFGVKASATAKHIAKSRITATSADKYIAFTEHGPFAEGDSLDDCIKNMFGYGGVENPEDILEFPIWVEQYDGSNDTATRRYAPEDLYDIAVNDTQRNVTGTKKHKAKSKITASMPDLEDIVMYFNGKKIYEGDGSGLTSAVEKLCEDDSIKDKFVEWCNQFGDPIAFESGDAHDTAFAFAWLVDTFRYEDLDKFYADGDGILNFEIFNKSDEVKGAKSIKCSSSDAIERAKQYIVDAYNNENWDSEDKTVDEYFKNEDLHKVGLVYTTLGDNDEYDYQISVDLIDPKVIVEIDGDVVYEDKYSNIDALADDLADFDWDDWYSYYIHKLPKEYDDIFSSIKKSVNAKIAASDNYYDEDIVFYFNGKKQFEGSIFDLAGTVEILCHDPKVMQVFQDYCNQFGDPFDFDGTPRDTALVFTKLVMFEAEGANEPSDFYVEYSDYRKPGSFEIYYANDGIYSAKSIKCAQGSYSDFDEDMPFYVAQYYDTKFRDTAESASFDDMDEAVDYAHECLGKGPTSIEHYSVGRVDIDPDEYWENFDGEFWCTPELAEWRDEVWKSMGISASKSIKCNDGIAPDDYDSVEDLVPEAYVLSGGEDDDMLEYVDDYIATEGCPATVNFVTYNTPNDWSVDVSKYGEAVVSDFIWYLEEVASELSDKFYDYPSYEDDTTRNAFKGTKYEEGGKYATFYGDDALVANDYEFQFYPAQNQWSAPQIEFDTDGLKLIGFTDDEIDKLMQIYEDYKTAWIENCKYINAHISEFLANLESNVNASTNIKAGLSLNLNAKPNYTDWVLRGYKFDGEDVTTLRIDFQDDVKQAVMDMFEDPDIETVDLYKIPTEQETTGVFEDEEYFTTFTREDINSSVDIEAGITVGEDSRFDFSNSIYELDDYVKAIADGVIDRIQGITYDISKETIAFFDADNNVVFVQPIGGIIPEPDDLETDIDELSAAIQSEMDNVYARDNWESDEDDSDYASRAVELSEDIGEVDIDDLEPITGEGEDTDYGFGFDSNGDAIDESTVEELYRIAEYEILPKSELAKIDEYVSIDEDSWDFYMSSPHVTEKFYIHFKLTEKDINFNDYTLPNGKMFPDFNYYTAVLDFDIYAENGEITSVILEDKKIYRPDGAFDDYDVRQFDDLYNVEALINYVEHLAADTVKDIYDGTTNL